MVSKSERTVSASLVFAEDGSVLSAFKTVAIEVLDDDGARLSETRRDVDLTPSEVTSLFGAKIDAHLTATNAMLDEARREKVTLESTLATTITEKDAEIATKEAARRAVAAELDQLKSEAVAVEKI